MSEKTYRNRMVKLPEMVAQDILEWRQNAVEDRGVGGHALTDDHAPVLSGFIFPRRKDGKAWTVSDRQNWRRRFFSEACKSAGLDGFAPKDLRHTAASLLVCTHIGRADLAERMGHSIQESEATYQHAIEAYRGQPARSMDEMIRAARIENARGVLA